MKYNEVPYKKAISIVFTVISVMAMFIMVSVAGILVTITPDYSDCDYDLDVFLKQDKPVMLKILDKKMGVKVIAETDKEYAVMFYCGYCKNQFFVIGLKKGPSACMPDKECSLRKGKDNAG